MRFKIRILTVALTIICSLIFSLVFYINNNTPNILYTDKSNYNTENNYIKCSLSNCNSDSLNYELKLLNLIPIKQVKLVNSNIKQVVLCGNQFGVKIYADGCIITSVSGVLTESGTKNPAYEAGLRKGDIIHSINDKNITSNEDIENIVSLSDKKLKIVYERKGKKYTTYAYSVISLSDGKQKLGIWIKDSIAGIGTATFYVPEYGITAGLGHGIYDNETNVLMPLNEGVVCDVKDCMVIKSAKGNIGEIDAKLSAENYGFIAKNCDSGIYSYGYEPDGQLIDVGKSGDIRKGSAMIYCSLNGKTCDYYECEIQKVNFNSDFKNMIIKITDKRLLEKTGGIIQGMSGSPIIQNGKLIGAVTHV